MDFRIYDSIGLDKREDRRMETLIGLGLTLLLAFFVYVQFHIQQEEREQKRIPFFWEKW